MSLGIKEIEAILPHRHPFLLIDRIDELEPGMRAVGVKAVTFHEEFFAGHFPGEPVMPGVLILEALAQVGAVAILSVEENKGKTAFFGGVDNVRFRRKVVPGDVLTLTCEIIRTRGNVGVGTALASVNGERAVTAEMTFVIS
ncbi:3-hydroxyacyl-ACP dehydratase FabZ [Hominifimenecus microfluidus]|uniref:3-hydroxyacyl-[acyl-carrier-protein] dehydratase FabZ n=1 Tax=Hominifimenecus microfluidus TaxID=2885348 RepID=A0AAE3JH58_9FIRM|nr:3-hydroxyacyl-ACP dehydratase FabZ [Hominifimenecus microfluidus]MCC2231506.1 3-hydroxyacyl-ACP dehydratase FabZ [Hominifimenecus microfluidus]